VLKERRHVGADGRLATHIGMLLAMRLQGGGESEWDGCAERGVRIVLGMGKPQDHPLAFPEEAFRLLLLLLLLLLHIKLRQISDQLSDFVDCLLQLIHWAEVAQLFRRRSAFPQSQ
jgi:hypothetical protein